MSLSSLQGTSMKLSIDFLRCIAIACVLCFVSYWAVYGPFGAEIRLFHRVDRCLDYGCAFVYEHNECDCVEPKGDGILGFSRSGIPGEEL